MDQLHHAKEHDRKLNYLDEVDYMLNNYDETVFHMHLFSDYDEVHLTKLDL